MIGKLFTPLKMGAIELGHRVVADCQRSNSTCAEAFTAENALRAAGLSTGMCVYDPAADLKSGAGGTLSNDLSRTHEDQGTRRPGWIQVARLSIGWDQSGLDGGSAARLQLGADKTCRMVEELAIAAQHARAAGFDGVELDSSEGTIPDLILSQQVLDPVSDGGEPDCRLEFIGELIEGLALAFEKDRIGIRLSPFQVAGDALRGSGFVSLLEVLNEWEIAYLNVTATSAAHEQLSARAYKSSAAKGLRDHYRGIIVVSDIASLSDARFAVESRWADAVAVPAEYLSDFLASAIETAGKP